MATRPHGTATCPRSPSRLSVYPFLPEWPGQAAANSDRAYGCVSSQDMVRRIYNKKREGGEVLIYAFVYPSGLNCENFTFKHLSPFPNKMKLSDEPIASFLQTASDPTRCDGARRQTRPLTHSGMTLPHTRPSGHVPFNHPARPAPTPARPAPA